MTARQLLCLAVLSAGCAHGAVPASAPGREAPGFELDGQPFCFAGSNNYYVGYKPRPVVDDVFSGAQALGFKVMRIWGMLDRGSLDGSVPNADGRGEKDGVYFQYWDRVAQRPAFNDGANGLERLDYALDAAARHDVRLIIVLTNNWRPFGGMDQYLIWYGLDKHHEFFEAAPVKEAYREWVEHLVTRRNSVNGRLYRDDPAILGWELANEPRCTNASSFDSPHGWSTGTLTRWADEMSAHVKSLDPNHLVSVGDEGFLNARGQHFAYRAEGGVDHAALTALPNVDFGTFHLYPEDWGVPAGFSERWIGDHLALAAELGKPTLLEEYGAKVQRTPDNRGAISAGWPERRDQYLRWHRTLLGSGGSASLAWMLASIDADGTRYPDYDQFAFYRDDATGKLLQGLATELAAAPKCRAADRAGTGSGSSSPYVRVTRR